MGEVCQEKSNSARRNNTENEGHVGETRIERIAVLGRDKLEELQTVELDERWWECGNGGNLRM